MQLHRKCLFLFGFELCIKQQHRHSFKLFTLEDEMFATKFQVKAPYKMRLFSLILQNDLKKETSTRLSTV